MLYRVKVGSVSAIVHSEQEALEMLGKLAATENEEVSVLDVLGSDVDVLTLKARLGVSNRGT